MESEWNAASFNILLANAGHYLRDVDIAAFTSSNDHAAQAIAALQTIKCQVAWLVSCVIQSFVYVDFERLEHILAWLQF